MCKAMESEGRGSNVGKGGFQDWMAPVSAAAAAQISASTAAQSMPLQGQPLHGLQQPERSAFEAAGVAEAVMTSAAGSSQQLPSIPGQSMAATLSGPSGSSRSTDLMYMQSSISSALSGHSVAAGLQEAMQQMCWAGQWLAAGSVPSAGCPAAAWRCSG